MRSGSEILSNIVASQMQMHAVYGGVVPELASREHLRNIVPVVREAIAKAGIAFADLDAIAVTEGPRTPPAALLVGITYLRSPLAFALDQAILAVNHLEGHIHAVLLEMRAQNQAAFADPILALVVSGGHTHLYLANEHEQTWHYRNVGRTLDDAAGEAFDKVAKLLGLGYPGGPWIDALAPHGNAHAVSLSLWLESNSKAAPRFCEAGASDSPSAQDRHLDFSFSGIKTAVLRHTETHAMQASIAARRDALSHIAEPKLADILPLCDKPTLGPHRRLSARRGRLSPARDIRRCRGVRREGHRHLWRRCRQPRAPRPSAAAEAARPGPSHRLPLARTCDRQRRYDRRRRLQPKGSRRSTWSPPPDDLAGRSAPQLPSNGVPAAESNRGIS